MQEGQVPRALAGLWEQVAVRFDVVGVTLHDETAARVEPTIEWLEDAFDAA